MCSEMNESLQKEQDAHEYKQPTPLLESPNLAGLTTGARGQDSSYSRGGRHQGLRGG